MYWKVSVGLKCVRISRIACLLNLSPLKTVVSRKFISLSEISAANLIVGWCLFARTINSSISFLSTFHSENMSSIYIFIIQQIFTMPIYGKEALNICHPYMTDILRYT